MKTKLPKPMKPQKIQAMQRKLYKEICEIRNAAEESLNAAKRKLQRGLVSAEDFNAFETRLVEWRDLEIEQLRDAHRAELRANENVGTWYQLKKVETATTEVESVDKEVVKVMGMWPWTPEQLKAKECRDRETREMDRLADELLQKM